MQNFIVDTLILRHEHRRIREKLNQTQYRRAQTQYRNMVSQHFGNDEIISVFLPLSQFENVPPELKMALRICTVQ